MSGKTTIWVVSAVLMLTVASSSVFGDDIIYVTVTGTADERWDNGPDYFGLWFDCDNDIRISQVIYDLTFANAIMWFDTVPHGDGAYDFTEVVPPSDPVGASHLSADGSPQLRIDFTDFQPGEMLYFAIDVDTSTSPGFTADNLAGARIGVALDLTPTFPGALPTAIELVFQNIDGAAIATVTTQIPEPTTVLLFVGGVTVAGLFRKRRPTTTCRRSK